MSESNNTIINIHQLSCFYQTDSKPIKIIHQLNLSIPKNQILGIMGESGAGKSTLLHAIIHKKAPLYHLNITGNIQFNCPLPSISIILQNPLTSLCPVLTIHQHFKHTFNAIQKDYTINKAIEWLEKVQLNQPHESLQKFPHEFSGGEQQRIAIALSICQSPILLLADEITSSLDPTVQKEILNLLIQLQKEFKFSLLMISHDLSVLSYIAHRIIVMKQGQIVEEGLKNEILLNPQCSYTQHLVNAFQSLTL